MSTVELKEIIKLRIDQINDEGVLDEINAVLNYKNSDILILSQEQKISIAKGQNDIAAGNFIEHNQLFEEIDQWLKE